MEDRESGTAPIGAGVSEKKSVSGDEGFSRCGNDLGCKRRRRAGVSLLSRGDFFTTLHNARSINCDAGDRRSGASVFHDRHSWTSGRRTCPIL